MVGAPVRRAVKSVCAHHRNNATARVVALSPLTLDSVEYLAAIGRTSDLHNVGHALSRRKSHGELEFFVCLVPFILDQPEL